jgi:hypothetical protein
VAHIRTHAVGAGFSSGLIGDETGLEAGLETILETTWTLASASISSFPGQLIKRRSGDRTAPTMKSTLRGLMFVAASAGLAWACLSTAAIALADDTPTPCDALKRIVAAAPDGFTSLRPDDGEAVALPYGSDAGSGAGSDAQCAKKAGTYTCSWMKGANAGSAADALQGVAADIAACLPDATHDQNSPGRQHFYIGARGQRTQITVTTAGAGKLTLAVSGK